MKSVYVALAVVCCMGNLVAGVYADELVWQEIGRENADFRSVVVDVRQPLSLLAGTQKGVVKSDDGGYTWRLSTGMGAVNQIAQDAGNNEMIYAACARGVWLSRNKGGSWQRVLRGKNSQEKNCRTIAARSSTVFVGTDAGMLVSHDFSRTWQKVSGELGRSFVVAIAFCHHDPDVVYAAASHAVFKSIDGGRKWRKIFFASNVKWSLSDAEELDEATEEEGTVSAIRHLVVDRVVTGHLYVATAQGVFESRDSGAAWQPVSGGGLLSSDVRFLLVSAAAQLYAATESSIFRYADRQWRELSFGLLAQEIRSMVLDGEGNLYAACKNGLFKTSMHETDRRSYHDALDSYGENEPSIAQVQAAAIAYADVAPEKIQQWRRQVQGKALLPKLSVGVNRDTVDLWHWESGSTTREGDDALVKGHDSIDWDVCLSWDLSELIFAAEQTSIDVRSRLMVELRDDLLDEVTKIYFERIRLKIELDDLRIEERKKRLEKELRLREITASLDALTGGYFSRNLPTHNERSSL